MAGFDLYRNGTLESDLVWSRSQLLAMSLTMSAYDGEIGMGSITAPGEPDQYAGWWTGDRISIVDQDTDKVLYTGYLISAQVNAADSVLDVETTWQLEDINRQFLGRTVFLGSYGGTFITPYSLDLLVGLIKPMIEGAGPPQPTVEDVTWVTTDATDVFPAKEYTSDGAADFIADIVAYFGFTVFLALTDDENEFELHVHTLASGPTASLTISDADFGTDIFQPSNPVRSMDATDIKDGVTGRNGTEDVVLSGEVGTFSAGGLSFNAFVDSGLDQNGLTLLVNTVIAASALPKTSYGCSILNLTGLQVTKARAGTQVPLTGVVFGLTAESQRVSRQTLTVSRDAAGNPRPGYWDLALEMGYPLRGPTAIRGYGGQGSGSGALSLYTKWTTTEPVVEDYPGIDVGNFETVTCQLRDDRGAPVPVMGVSITWSVLQADKVTVHPDYSTLDDDLDPATTSLTDISGQAHIIVQRDANTIGATHTVKAEPT